MSCKAYQASDQMICGHCGLQWDVNDPDPPPCPRNAEEDLYKQRPSRAEKNRKSTDLK